MEADSTPPEKNQPPSTTEESENWARGFRSMMMSRESGVRFMSQVQENASLVLEVVGQWEDFKKVVELKELSFKKQILELKDKEERVSVVEERERMVGLREDSVIHKLGVVEEKEKESDLRHFLEAVVMRLVIELQKEDMVTQLNDQEKKLQDSMINKHEEAMGELRAVKEELSLISKSFDEKRRDFDLKQTIEIDRRREEAELMEISLKKLEARENELQKKEETFELQQKEKAREIESKAKSLELKEKELDERIKEIEARSVQAETRKRSRLEVGTSLLGEMGSDADTLSPPGKRHRLITEHIYNDVDQETNLARLLHEQTSSDPASEQRTEGYEIVCRDDQIVDPDPEPYDCPDPDFNDFRNTMSSFKAGQIWALYDESDEMPRYYAQIRKVMKSKLDVRVTWLESVHNPRNEKLIPIACGVFNYGNTETIDSHLTFSHEMENITRSGIEVTITPRKGETWALFRDWTKTWISDREQHKPPYRYDFVEILSEFDSKQGIGVSYLGTVEGFTSVYQRAEQHGFKQMMIPSDSMLKFSHRVPSVKLNGDEKEGVPPGSFELDPAAIPRAYLKAAKVKKEEIKAIGWV